jgi:flagellar motor switch protein FliN/FliY
VLTEMHLDALTVAFSDMLTRTVDGIAAGLSEPLEAGDLDLGMESELPEPDAAGTRVLLALDIAGFGPFPIVQQADADLTQFLMMHALADISGVATAAAAAAPAAHAAVVEEAPHAPAGQTPADAVDEGADSSADIVGALPSAGGSAATNATVGDLDMLMNVPLPLTVELGQTQRTIRELVDFSIGSIIELGKLAGDPLDIKVNDRVIARGEVVVIDEEFGIRVTEIVSPEDRLRGLA